MYICKLNIILFYRLYYFKKNNLIFFKYHKYDNYVFVKKMTKKTVTCDKNMYIVIGNNYY